MPEGTANADVAVASETLPDASGASAERFKIGAALFAVYVIWGSTYYAMHVALEFLPPFSMAGPRFLLAGSILFVVLLLRGAKIPAPREWLGSGFVGLLFLACGNGLVAVAQRSIDTGVAATIVATMPLWTAAIGRFFGDRPSKRELAGLLLGFAGVAVLQSGGNLTVRSMDGLVILLAPMAWALGSVLSRKIRLAPGAMNPAVQMLVGGVTMIGIALVLGERPHGPPTARTVGALLYLVVFGSLIGFSAFGYLLRATRPAVATSYAYVNPVVALAIGTVLAHERITAAKIVACALTILGVVVASAPRLGPVRGAPAKG